MSSEYSNTSQAYADMPPDQLQYFSGRPSDESRSPLKSTNEANYQAIPAAQLAAMSCPHEARRTSPPPARGARQSTLPGQREPRSTTSQRSDVFEKYKQYFSGSNTPASQSLSRSERSGHGGRSTGTGKVAGNAAAQAQPSLYDPSAPARPRLAAGNASHMSSASDSYAQPLQEPHQQGAAYPPSESSRSVASSAARGPARNPLGNEQQQPQYQPSFQRQQPVPSQPVQYRSPMQPSSQVQYAEHPVHAPMGHAPMYGTERRGQPQQPAQARPQQQQTVPAPEYQQQSARQQQTPTQVQLQQPPPQQPSAVRPDNRSSVRSTPSRGPTGSAPAAPQPVYAHPAVPARQQTNPAAANDGTEGRPTGDGDVPTSRSTRLSEPQVVSCQPYEQPWPSRDDHIPAWQSETVMPPPPPNAASVPRDTTGTVGGPHNAAHRDPTGLAAMHEVPASYMGDDSFSDRSASDGAEPALNPSQSYNSHNVYNKPAAAAAQPPSRPSRSRASNSTASVATASSAYDYGRQGKVPSSRGARARAEDGGAAGQPAGGSSAPPQVREEEESEENWTFHPSINQPLRQMGQRRPDYGHDEFTGPQGVSAGRSKRAKQKNQYAELDQDSDDVLMPRPSGTPPRALDEDAEVFSRLYADAQRYNDNRAQRERRIERQRQIDRGEILDDEAADGSGGPGRHASQETAQPSRPSGGAESGEDGEEKPARERSGSTKRHVTFEVFDRLSRPLNVTQKFEQQREHEKQAKEAADRKAKEEKAEEMQAVAAYRWDIPSPFFRMADLAQQNSLFVG